MARSESNTHEPHSAPGKETLQENGNTVDANGSNNSTERRQWDFDAPRYWDLENPDAGSGFDDTWFARRPVTPNVASPSSAYQSFSERKPRRSGVKGSPLRMIRTPENQSTEERPSISFLDLPATPLTSKTLNNSSSHYATPMADKTTQSKKGYHDLEIPLSPFLSNDLITSSTPNFKSSSMPKLPARATAMSTSREQFMDREPHGNEENSAQAQPESRGTKRTNGEDNEGRVWDEENKEFRPVIDDIKRRISTIVFKCTNRDISTPLRRRSLLSDRRRRVEDVADQEDADAKAALVMLKEAIKEAKEHESMILDEPPIELDGEELINDTQIPSPDIPTTTETREIVRGTDTSMYMKSPPITTDGERRYITVYLPRQLKIPERSHRSLIRSPNASISSLRPSSAESDNPFEVNPSERESWEKGLHHSGASTSARLASLNERLRRAESAESSKKASSYEPPRSPYLPFKPTVPRGPSLETSKRVKNSNFLSAEERDLEEARKHQFKAHPVNKRVLESRGHLGVPEAKSSLPTVPHSPTFHTLSGHSH